MKVNRPNPINSAAGFKYELAGNILLDYKGGNADLQNRKAFRKGSCLINYIEFQNKESKFNFILFGESFYYEKIELDLYLNNLTINDALSEFGTFEIEKICLDNLTLFISGKLLGVCFGLASYLEDVIKFDMILELPNLDLNKIRKDMRRVSELKTEFRNIKYDLYIL